MKKLIDRIEKYGFTCEAGPIEKCVEWIELKNLTSAIHSDGEGRCPICREPRDVCLCKKGW